LISLTEPTIGRLADSEAADDDDLHGCWVVCADGPRREARDGVRAFEVMHHRFEEGTVGERRADDRARACTSSAASNSVSSTVTTLTGR